MRNTQSLGLIRLEFCSLIGKIGDTTPMVAVPLNRDKPKLSSSCTDITKKRALLN